MSSGIFQPNFNPRSNHYKQLAFLANLQNGTVTMVDQGCGMVATQLGPNTRKGEKQVVGVTQSSNVATLQRSYESLVVQILSIIQYVYLWSSSDEISQKLANFIQTIKDVLHYSFLVEKTRKSNIPSTGDFHQQVMEEHNQCQELQKQQLIITLKFKNRHQKNLSWVSLRPLLTVF